MPKREDIKKILILGSGPIVIGQACEFDYSGTQAVKALKSEGYTVILVNPNPATVMTTPGIADKIYMEPLEVSYVEKIIRKEKPDAILPTMGGQTGLNLTLDLHDAGVLQKYGVEIIGASIESIKVAEDRGSFKELVKQIGENSPESILVKTVSEAQTFINKTGLPVIIRPSFTLGGKGGSIAGTPDEVESLIEKALFDSPVHEVLIEESLIGWKEFEMEVMRDHADNVVVICSIENVDPMGVHTGDSITVAPALTLSDKEYQIMRNASIAVLREIGVETGGSNVQFAVNPADGRLIVIEMNPRVSRSSALASKATGFPIAKVATKLAVGYTLDELKNEITGGATPASFEPTIDYVVTKIPRFAFEKFPGAEPVLSTAMKSVGEVMAIGRTFTESLQKALRSLETDLDGLDEIEFEGLGQGDDKNVIRSLLSRATPDRLVNVAQALRHGVSHERIYDLCRIDPWFIDRLQEVVDLEGRIKAHGLPQSAELFANLKSFGFSDRRLASLAGLDVKTVRAQRHALGIRPVFKRIDSCAAEFASPTAYMYSTYERPLLDEPICESRPSVNEKVIILGGGPNRIGQGIEFDYCCCHAAFALQEQGIETIMVNCNPETVSTDYDTSDRLYFEPLSEEDVLEIIYKEQQNGTLRGIIVQLGGQTPLKLAGALERENIPILGTEPDAIDLAEDRDRFKKLVDTLGLKQPNNGIAHTEQEAREIAKRIGFPVVIRPSYVLGGRAMEIVHDEQQLDRYIAEAVNVSGDSPVLIDSFLRDAIEVDVDAICDENDIFVSGIMQHIEEAGIHSGDSACSLPPYSLDDDILQELHKQTGALARALRVKGLMNVQFAIKDRDIYLIEVNPRASRTVPFVAKVTGLPLAGIATKVMAGTPLADFDLKKSQYDHIAVKEAVFPFDRFPGVDPVLGPEMRSTGEVMGIDRDFAIAFAKSQLGAGAALPLTGTVFVSVRDIDKERVLGSVRHLVKMGFEIIATGGTQRYLVENELACERVFKVHEGRPNIVDAIKNGEVDMVINTTEGAKAHSDSASIRRTALLHHVPYYTTIAGVNAVTKAIQALKDERLDVVPIQNYLVSPPLV